MYYLNIHKLTRAFISCLKPAPEPDQITLASVSALQAFIEKDLHKYIKYERKE